MLIPIGTIILVILLQISFWFPTAERKERVSDEKTKTTANTTSIAPDDPRVASPSSDEKSSTPQETTEDKQGRGVRNITRIIPQKNIAPENFQCVFITDDKPGEQTLSPENGNKLTPRSNDRGQNNVSTLGKRSVWKCSCELGFLPAGMLKTFGNAEAIMRLGVGQCYHKKS